jgi:hypothetical protein
LASILNMDLIRRISNDDQSTIYQYKFNIDKIQEKELAKEYT